MIPCSNGRVILRIQSGNDGDQENIQKNIDYVNDRVRNDSPMNGKPKTCISYANIFQGVIEETVVVSFIFSYLGYQCETLVADPCTLGRCFTSTVCEGGSIYFNIIIKITQ